MTLLGYQEKDVWRMTLRKLCLLYDEYLKDRGQTVKQPDIDDIIPF